MREYLTFKKMITPAMVQVLFWVGILFSVSYGISLIQSGMGPQKFMASQKIKAGISLIILGPIIVRIWCESLIIFFRIYQTLTNMKQKNGSELTFSMPEDPEVKKTEPEAEKLMPKFSNREEYEKWKAEKLKGNL